MVFFPELATVCPEGPGLGGASPAEAKLGHRVELRKYFDGCISADCPLFSLLLCCLSALLALPRPSFSLPLPLLLSLGLRPLLP